MARTPEKPTLDPEIAKIAETLRERSMPNAALGRQLGLDSKQINRLLNGERRLQRHELEIAREWLWPGSAPTPRGGTIVPMPSMVPLYGWVGAASAQRLTFAEQNLRGYVPMHPAQAGIRDAFALEVADISMSPRYEPGEIVYLAPRRWPARGQDCVVVTTSGSGFLKRFITLDEETMHCWQLNPAGEADYPRSDIEAVHAVVGRG
jgi:SOS-response transcriptional repressor LexA